RPRPEAPPVTMARTEAGSMAGSCEGEAANFTVGRALARRIRTSEPTWTDSLRLLDELAGEFLGGQAWREQEALANRHAQLEHELPLRLRLDALGHDVQAKAAGDAGDRLADRDIGLVARHALHEQLDELEPMDRQAAQVVERAVAFAEVVDREHHAKVTHRSE